MIDEDDDADEDAGAGRGGRPGRGGEDDRAGDGADGEWHDALGREAWCRAGSSDGDGLVEEPGQDQGERRGRRCRRRAPRSSLLAFGDHHVGVEAASAEPVEQAR